MNGAQHLDDIRSVTALLAESFENLGNPSGIASKETDTFDVNERKFLLYALGGTYRYA